jgi:hypothetical protein
VKLLFISEGTAKKSDECGKTIVVESYLYERCTGTRVSEQYLRENNACGYDG